MLRKALCTHIFAECYEVAGPWRQRNPLLDADDTIKVTRLDLVSPSAPKDAFWQS